MDGAWTQNSELRWTWPGICRLHTFINIVSHRWQRGLASALVRRRQAQRDWQRNCGNVPHWQRNAGNVCAMWNWQERDRKMATANGAGNGTQATELAACMAGTAALARLGRQRVATMARPQLDDCKEG